ncbi:hypothetical protein [Halomicrobium urmianum]|uniref:hypothetical protein n=1 Tax=Halomicrobium urmianum TaxID=1586233 RepID=UPI001CD9B568|nr:hypothetical protein [Halomicrobium urmianum]
MSESTRRDDLLAEIEDDDRRRTVGALTDLQQTHLTRRDARDWGGSRGWHE